MVKTNFAIRWGRPWGAFTLVELLVIVALTGFFAMILVPACAHLRPDSQAMQCQNNLRQMARAWEMYSQDNGGKIVSAYPQFGGFTATWCAGAAQTGGSAGSYTYGGADPAGIQTGLLWPYVKALGPYHCPTDHRIANAAGAPFPGQPILRSISMNSFMDGTSLGANPPWTVTSPGGSRDPNHPVYIKESEIKQPKQTFVFVEEDQVSINDGMLLVDVGGSLRLVDLPSRSHRFGYGISFVDGHAAINQFQDDATKNWQPGQLGGLRDWAALTNVTTHPL